MRVLDLRTLADEWNDTLGECHECGEPIEEDPDGSQGVLVHDRSLDNAHDLDEDHAARPDVQKYEDLCGELGVEPTPDGLRYYGDNHEPTLVHEDDFEDYARELADDLGLINQDMSWPYTCIDWERAARELGMDYTTVSYDGDDYYTRS